MNPGKPVALHPFRQVLNFSALQRDVIRMAAFMAMVGDHIATAFQLDMLLLNMAGRCAFPLFALVSGCNMAGKTLRQHSFNRLWLMPLLAQPGYWLAFREAGLMWLQLNILFAFAVVMQVTRFLQAATVLNGVAAFTALESYAATVEAGFSPEGTALQLVIKTIETAQQEIRLMGYSFTSPEVVGALVRAKLRGVDVGVVLGWKAKQLTAISEASYNIHY